MRSEAPSSFPREPLIVQGHEPNRIPCPLSPYQSRHMRRAAGLGVGAWPHWQCGERASRQEMLQCKVAMRMLMRDGTDHRGLVVRYLCDRNTSLLPQRRIAPLCTDDKLA